MNGVSAHDVVMDGGMGDVWLWWLEHGLDGIAGAVLAIGGLAVTLWFDRRARMDTHDREELKQQKATVTAIMTVALDVAEMTSYPPKADEEIRAALRQLERDVRVARPVLSSIDGLGPTLVLLGALTYVVSGRERMDVDLAGRLLYSISHRCEEWLKNPAEYSDERMDKGERFVDGRTTREAILFTVVGDDFGPEPGGET